MPVGIKRQAGRHQSGARMQPGVDLHRHGLIDYP